LTRRKPLNASLTFWLTSEVRATMLRPAIPDTAHRAKNWPIVYTTSRIVLATLENHRRSWRFCRWTVRNPGDLAVTEFIVEEGTAMFSNTLRKTTGGAKSFSRIIATILPVGIR